MPDHGEGDHRPAALLWHSVFVDERSWERVIPDLAQDRQLILVTGPGHGMSRDIGHQYSMEDCAEAAIEVLQSTGVEGPVDWVGNAWGGHVGIVVAPHHPDRVRTLVTSGTPVHPYIRADRPSTHLLAVLYSRRGTQVVDGAAYLVPLEAPAEFSRANPGTLAALDPNRSYARTQASLPRPSPTRHTRPLPDQGDQEHDRRDFASTKLLRYSFGAGRRRPVRPTKAP